MLLNTHYEQILELIMKSSYQHELEYLLNNPRRAKKNSKRINEIKEILAAQDALQIYEQRARR